MIRFPFRAIKSERQHAQAVAVIARLSIRGHLDAGRGELSKRHIRQLADHFHVDPGLSL